MRLIKCATIILSVITILCSTINSSYAWTDRQSHSYRSHAYNGHRSFHHHRVWRNGAWYYSTSQYPYPEPVQVGIPIPIIPIPFFFPPFPGGHHRR